MKVMRVGPLHTKILLLNTISTGVPARGALPFGAPPLFGAPPFWGALPFGAPSLSGRPPFWGAPLSGRPPFWGALPFGAPSLSGRLPFLGRPPFWGAPLSGRPPFSGRRPFGWSPPPGHPAQGKEDQEIQCSPAAPRAPEETCWARKWKVLTPEALLAGMPEHMNRS